MNLLCRLAADNGAALDEIRGTHVEGRIARKTFQDRQGMDKALIATASAMPTSSTPVPTPALPASDSAAPDGRQPLVNARRSGALVPLSKMRTIIARRMVESAQQSPHVHTVFKIDMTRIVALREREKVKYQQRNGVRLTYMPFIGAAVIDALCKFPIINASMESDSIRYHENINLGVAVALDWGLIVPVVKRAEDRSFPELARAIADLAERARGKRLKPDEASGSTFTLTNSGIFGEEFGTPIINQPEAAILAIGGMKKEPVVITDADGNDTIAVRWLQHFCLGFDHRIIDGADAGKFMGEFKKTLENWEREIG